MENDFNLLSFDKSKYLICGKINHERRNHIFIQEREENYEDFKKTMVKK